MPLDAQRKCRLQLLPVDPSPGSRKQSVSEVRTSVLGKSSGDQRACGEIAADTQASCP